MQGSGIASVLCWRTEALDKSCLPFQSATKQNFSISEFIGWNFNLQIISSRGLSHHLFRLGFSFLYPSHRHLDFVFKAYQFFLWLQRSVCKPSDRDFVVEEEWDLQTKSYKLIKFAGFLFVLQIGALVFTSQQLCRERCFSACCFAASQCYCMSLPQAFMLIINSLMPGKGGNFLFLKLPRRIPFA